MVGVDPVARLRHAAGPTACVASRPPRRRRKRDIKLAWGTDTLFDPALATRQGKQLAKMDGSVYKNLLER